MPPTLDRWAIGDGAFLTTAFRAYGALPQESRVTRILRSDEVSAGSTGRKLVLSVDYDVPGPHRELFMKFSRDFDDPRRDLGRTQMRSEVEFAALTLEPGFPVAVPTVMFAAYEGISGTGILITERIPFGRNGIEGQYAKCMDYDTPDQLGHYRALLGAVGRLAGTDAAGRLPHQLTADMEQLSVGERAPLTVDRLHRRVDRLAEFSSSANRRCGSSFGNGATSWRSATGTPTSTTRGSGATPMTRCSAV